MPCYQSTSLPSGASTTGRTSYATESDCLNACKEGACCDGTTCSVTPQCQCQGTGKTFLGIGTTCNASSCPCGGRAVSVSVTIEETYTADGFVRTFAPHHGTMMPYSDPSYPSTDYQYRTHRYQATPNYSGNPVYLAASAEARLKCVGDQAVFALTGAALVQFDPAISFNFYGCTITGSYGAGFYQRASGSDVPSSQLAISESWIGKTKDNMWDWLVGKVFAGTYYTYQYCYLNPTAHDRVDMKLTIDSVQYL